MLLAHLPRHRQNMVSTHPNDAHSSTINHNCTCPFQWYFYTWKSCKIYSIPGLFVERIVSYLVAFFYIFIVLLKSEHRCILCLSNHLLFHCTYTLLFCNFHVFPLFVFLWGGPLMSIPLFFGWGFLVLLFKLLFVK